MWCDFYQVEPGRYSRVYGFFQWHNASIFPIGVDEPDGRNANLPIYTIRCLANFLPPKHNDVRKTNVHVMIAQSTEGVKLGYYVL